MCEKEISLAQCNSYAAKALLLGQTFRRFSAASLDLSSPSLGKALQSDAGFFQQKTQNFEQNRFTENGMPIIAGFTEKSSVASKW